MQFGAALLGGVTAGLGLQGLNAATTAGRAAIQRRLSPERLDVVLRAELGKQGIDWGSPVSRQYKLESIPYMRVYGPDGQLVADGDQARTMVMEMAQKAGL